MRHFWTKKLLYITHIAILTTLVPSISSAKPTIKIHYKNYKIRGQNISEIKDAIKSFSLTASNGEKFTAKTNYEISWDYKFDKTILECKIASIRTHVALTYQMPELENIQDLSEDTKTQWNQYYSSLKLHEDGHAQLGIDAATEIEDTIKNMPPRKNCKTLANDANKLGKKIIEKHHNDNLSYDQRTRHGYTQGAFLVSRIITP